MPSRAATRWRASPAARSSIGNSDPVRLMDMIAILEQLTGREAVKQFLDMQPGDVPATYADAADLEDAVGFRPATPLREGLTRCVAWYRDYYRV